MGRPHQPPVPSGQRSGGMGRSALPPDALCRVAGGPAGGGREPCSLLGSGRFLERAGPLSWLRAPAWEAALSDGFQMGRWPSASVGRRERRGRGRPGRRGRRRHVQGRPETEACRLPSRRLCTSEQGRAPGPAPELGGRWVVHFLTEPPLSTHTRTVSSSRLAWPASVCASAPAGTSLSPGRARSPSPAAGTPRSGRKGVTCSQCPRQGGGRAPCGGCGPTDTPQTLAWAVSGRTGHAEPSWALRWR